MPSETKSKELSIINYRNRERRMRVPNRRAVFKIRMDEGCVKIEENIDGNKNDRVEETKKLPGFTRDGVEVKKSPRELKQALEWRH